MVLSHEPCGSDITVGVKSGGTSQIAQSVRTTPRSRDMSSLAIAVLNNLPHGTTVEAISSETGVEESIVAKKVQDLKTGRFLTEDGKLTQDGYEAIQS